MLKPEVRPTTKGYHLYDFGSHWEFHSHIGVFKGSMKQVFTHAVVEYGFSINELEVGVLEMNKHFHNGSAYGIFKSFIFSFDIPPNDKLH